jgi:CheY-like chemotaxis protein
MGKGCTVVVRLPLAEAPRLKPVSKAVQDLPTRTGYRLMVVDDNRDSADTFATLLRLHGHEVQVAHNGAAALDLAKTFLPMAVFLDIGMPGLDGYEVARRMRQTPGLENTALIALTGWGQDDDRGRAAEAGFHHHLIKPADPDAIDGLLTRFCASD